MSEIASSNDEAAVLKWMTDRLLKADIVRHYFDLKQAGKIENNDAEAIFVIIQKLMLGSCGFFASVIAREIGQDHLVWIYSKVTDRLLHSVVATSPQLEASVLRGSYVDVLGRGNLRDLVDAMESIAGPVSVEIGGPIDHVDYLDGEEAAMIKLAEALPWTRQFMPASRNGSMMPEFFEAMSAVGSFRRETETIYTAASFR
jgi:hypothetical protein